MYSRKHFGRHLELVTGEGLSQVQIQPKRNTFSQTTSRSDTPVKVSLHDCLACSGCVTTAEAVLLESQSADELWTRLKLAKAHPERLVVVVSLSPQSVASLAAYYNLQSDECATKLAFYLKELGAKVVVDTSWARDISLLETAAEFIEKKKQQPSSLPMMASACPGWVVYAEKTHGAVLPHISTSKSPQAVMGTLVKNVVAKQWSVEPETIYHATVMPCYDKKLEAVRDDFTIATDTVCVPETDCVLATSELQALLEKQGVDDLRKLDSEPLDALFGGHSHGVSSARGGSGGYLEYVYRRAAQDLYGIQIPPGPLPMVRGRNSDMREINLIDEQSGEVLLRFAAAYGFRNIQGQVRKMKLNSCLYDYIEVMACPSGCLNGGGQLKAHRGGETPQQLIERLDNVYHASDGMRGGGGAMMMPEQNTGVVGLYDILGLQQPYSEYAKAIFHTKYHERQKSMTAAVKDW